MMNTPSQSFSERDTWRNHLRLQICEIDMLLSMYPGHNEIVFYCPDIIDELRLYIDDDYPDDDIRSPNNEEIPRTISFLMHLKIPIKTDGVFTSSARVVIDCSFPHGYPVICHPELSVRCADLSRTSNSSLNADLKDYISSSLPLGELCIGDCLSWLHDNISNYATKSAISGASVKAANPTPNSHTSPQHQQKPSTFSRLWIYSHHLYSQEKRKNIIEWAKDLKLTGFSLPGKPGVVCLEGPDFDVDEHWNRLRRLNWKRITVKHREDFKVTGKKVGKLRAFSDFEEKNFAAHSHGHGGRDYHMDLGMLKDYLKQHDLDDIFQILFDLGS